MEEIKLLIQLQKLDLKIDKNIKDEKLFYSRLKQIEEELKTIEEDFLKKKEELKNTKKEKLKKELQLREIDEKLKRHEDEKYKVKSKQEFEALEKEIANLEEEKSREEDYLLDLMEKEEELSGLLPSLEKQLQTNRENLTREREELNNKIGSIKKGKENLTREREELSSKIGKVYYEQYERLRKMRDGLAVVAVEDGICTGCNVKVSPSLIGQIKRGQIVYCEGCSRIIYLGNRSGS